MVFDDNFDVKSIIAIPSNPESGHHSADILTGIPRTSDIIDRDTIANEKNSGFITDKIAREDVMDSHASSNDEDSPKFALPCIETTPKNGVHNHASYDKTLLGPNPDGISTEAHAKTKSDGGMKPIEDIDHIAKKLGDPSDGRIPEAKPIDEHRNGTLKDIKAHAHH